MRRLGYALMVLGTATVLLSSGVSQANAQERHMVHGSERYSVYVSEGEVAFVSFLHPYDVDVSLVRDDYESLVLPLAEGVSVRSDEGADFVGSTYLIFGRGERIKFRIRGDGVYLVHVARDKNPVAFTGSKRYRQRIEEESVVIPIVVCNSPTYVSLKVYDPEGYKIASNSGDGAAFLFFVASTPGYYHYRINVEDEDAECIFTTPTAPVEE